MENSAWEEWYTLFDYIMESILGKRWKVQNEIVPKSGKSDIQKIKEVLLKNRNLTTKKEQEEFLDPPFPKNIPLSRLKISQKEMKRTIGRIKKAIKNKEKIIIYGDYDADGICGTAILWETLFKLKANVLPHLPERFSEGYGLNTGSIKKLKEKYPALKLIITVDNGIVANSAVDFAGEVGIDVIITDHHQKSKTPPKAFSIIHTILISGSAVAWFLSRELGISYSLELAAIGTIADQIPLLDVNRSIVKHGLLLLRKTKRLGLLSLLASAAIEPNDVSIHTVGFAIAPRLNAMGRLGQAIDSLRLLCTSNVAKARELSKILSKTNLERQKIVEEVARHARESVVIKKSAQIIVVSHETYHEGVIGLAASRLVEEFYRPVIVLSKGESMSKASARSIPGINIIKLILEAGEGIVTGGGHEMAAGFSIATADIDIFTKRINRLSKTYLTPDLLKKSLKIDMNLEFSQINNEFHGLLKEFDPTGIGNPTPTFASKKVEIVNMKVVGQDKKHLKLDLKQQGIKFGAIAFGMGEYYSQLKSNELMDIAYNIEENIWNGNTSLQLKIKDLKLR